MNWKLIAMNALGLLPGLVTAAEGIKGSGADKKTQVLSGVMLGMNAFRNVDPEDFERVFSNPHVAAAFGQANDAIHFALKTVDTVSTGLPAPVAHVPTEGLVVPPFVPAADRTSTPSSVPTSEQVVDNEGSTQEPG